MHSPLRRKIVQSLAFLPFMGNTILKGSTPSGVQELTRRAASPELALTAVRFFNTLEAAHNHNHHSFASLEALRRSRVLSKTLRTGRAHNGSRPPIVEELFARIDPDSKELIPGWSFQLDATEEGNAYLLTLRSNTEVFVSDESGVIYRGTALADARLPQGYASIRQLHAFDLSPIRRESAQRRSRPSELLRRVAFLSVSTSPMEDRCENGNCSGGASIGCCNLGYETCIWCCYSGCDAACLFCGMGVQCWCPIQ